MEKKEIARVWVDDHAVYAETKDGLQASYSFDLWPRLLGATDAQRGDFSLSYSGIHWPALDEDLSFESMFHQAGFCDITETEDSVYYPVSVDEDSPLPTAAESTISFGK